jgi:hypothetical protein
VAGQSTKSTVGALQAHGLAAAGPQTWAEVAGGTWLRLRSYTRCRHLRRGLIEGLLGWAGCRAWAEGQRCVLLLSDTQ